ncbi:MAG: DUF4392 domain-containing protein [Oscillospiraceae bacterium]|nr:DUF4392 domain-containing protein [Oscillospiraceae bacterium]
MTAYELSVRQAGENLDALMNLDPRGYGVCRALYPMARKLTDGPVSIHAAEYLLEHLKAGEFCYVMTGFILLPHECPETDGAVSSMVFCRMLAKMGVKPVVICPEDCREPMRAMAAAAGLHFYDREDVFEKVKALPVSVGFVAFPKEREAAERKTEELLKKEIPAAAVAIELPGANEKGVYHNAVGLDLTRLEAKTDLLLKALREKGVPTVAIGDLGNEAGLAALKPELSEKIPYTGPGECRCGCGGGIAAETAADRVLTATASDWGCMAVAAAMALLTEREELLPDGKVYAGVLEAGCRAGLVDMNGWHIPAVDGFGEELLLPVIGLMAETCRNILRIRKSGECGHWFEGMLSKNP